MLNRWMFMSLPGVLIIFLQAKLINGDEKTAQSNTRDHYSSAESILVREQMERYQDRKFVRPVLNASHTVMVNFGIGLIQILDFNQKDQMLSTLVWKRYVWVDERIGWNPAQHDGIESILLPTDKVWTPDIVLYNNVGNSDVEKHTSLLLVDCNGTVTWIPAVKYQSSCAVDMTDFPFDEQECVLRFGPWVYDSTKLDMVFLGDNEEFDLAEYLPNSEWDIIENTAVKRIQKYPCCVNRYTDIVFKMRLKRKVTFHMRLILVPTVLLSAMSAAIFWIPPNRPDRTSLGLSLFSSFFLLLIIVVNSSPPTAAAKLGTYYIAIILLVSIGVLYSVTIINVCQSQKPMPKIIEKIFLDTFGCIVCETRPPRKDIEHNAPLNPSTNDSEKQELNQKTVNGNKWKLFAAIVDRIVFTFFFLALVFAFVCVFPKPWYLFIA